MLAGVSGGAIGAGHDLGGDLGDRAPLVAGLTPQPLERFPLAQALTGDQHALAGSITTRGVQRVLELLGQFAPLLALHSVGNGDRS